MGEAKRRGTLEQRADESKHRAECDERARERMRAANARMFAVIEREQRAAAAAKREQPRAVSYSRRPPPMHGRLMLAVALAATLSIPQGRGASDA
jgi:hypothetical protein